MSKFPTLFDDKDASTTARLPLPSPATVTLEFRRPATNEATTAIATMVSGSDPPRYELPPVPGLAAGWDTTEFSGKWHIKVAGHKSSSAQFKIDKREQIVQVANSWVGAPQAQLGAGANCNDLSARVYSHVGLPIGTTTNNQYNNSTDACSGNGCLLFYSVLADWDAAHVAIEASGQRINLNSRTKPLPDYPVTQENKDAGIPTWYQTEIRSRSTVNLDED